MPSDAVQNERNLWNDYIDAVVSEVKFRPDRADIRLEYEEHLSDAFDTLREEGLSEDDALAAVVANMGDPVEAGRALNRAHNPILGWIESALRFILIIVLCLSFYFLAFQVVPVGIINVINYFRGYATVDSHGALLRTVDIDRTITCDGIVMTFDEIRLYEDGAIELRYRSRIRLLERGRLGISDFPVGVSDENGTPYVLDLVTPHYGGLITYYQFFCVDDPRFLRDYPPIEFGKLIVDIGSGSFYKAHTFRFTIDLEPAGKETTI